ncbi:peptidylprolyl isomerase [Lignipirellula cremea]|uniref:peptidylprolyl isomerase n=1 Tax=Lignipirellula cremea TaxID=2528010 RepID=UPI0018D25016|nr:peptidylprolyl isomerase [Lignipirellula cremea]
MTDVLAHLRESGELGAVVRSVRQQQLVRQWAEQRSLSATLEEIQRAADSFRASAGLQGAEETRYWLEQNGMTPDDLERRAELAVLRRKLMEQIQDVAVEQAYAESRENLSQARISHILVDSENLAGELLLRLREEGASFVELARAYSKDSDNADNGGYLGVIRGDQLAPPVCEEVFAAEPGDYLGPYPEGPFYQLLQVRELLPAQLDETTVWLLRERLFEEILQVAAGSVEFTPLGTPAE